MVAPPVVLAREEGRLVALLSEDGFVGELGRDDASGRRCCLRGEVVDGVKGLANAIRVRRPGVRHVTARPGARLLMRATDNKGENRPCSGTWAKPNAKPIDCVTQSLAGVSSALARETAECMFERGCGAETRKGQQNSKRRLSHRVGTDGEMPENAVCYSQRRRAGAGTPDQKHGAELRQLLLWCRSDPLPARIWSRFGPEERARMRRKDSDV